MTGCPTETAHPTAQSLAWFRRKGWICTAVPIACCLLASLAGCTRSFYRQQADRDVTRLVDCVPENPHWREGKFSIQIDPRSRMYSSADPDCPPMPSDDPKSHRYMQCVDCKKGSPCWKCRPVSHNIDNPYWLDYIVRDEQGAVELDLRGAVEMARLQSPDYQEQLEELYLSALDVTFERFRLDTQFFGGTTTFYTSDGPDRTSDGGTASSLLAVNPLPSSNRLRAEKMFASGAEMVVGLANSLVWEFSGTNSHVASTLIDFSLIQPLLRASGRAVVLERLTIAERTLLANVRQMQRYQRGFYTNIAIGRSAGAGPSRRGGFFGGSGLDGFSGVGGGGFGRVGSGGGGLGGGGTGAASAGGYLGLLQNIQEIRNQEANVAGLRDSLDQITALNDAGRLGNTGPIQVGQAQQALYNAQSRLLTSKAGLQSTLDSFKRDLGLPPDLDIKITDSQLDRFKLIDQSLLQGQRELKRLLEGLRSEKPDDVKQFARFLESIPSVAEDVRRQLAEVHKDFEHLQEQLPRRRESLQELVKQEQVTRGDLDESLFDMTELNQRVATVKADLKVLDKKMKQSLAALGEVAKSKPEIARPQMIRIYSDLYKDHLELSLIKARIRLDSITLLPVNITPVEALKIASYYRRDWKNTRAALVDSWRLIEFNANELQSSLDLVFSGDISNTGDNPLRLQDSTGRLRVGFEFDAPLTRLAERNTYRQALIEYQQARRSYYQQVDQIHQSFRNTLRTVRLNELNFEVRRDAVLQAITQYDMTRLKLDQPPSPNEAAGQSGLGATTTRDLVDALSSLLNAQNDFMSVWVNYEVQRVNLDFDLGTMQLDKDGVWIDPGEELGNVAIPPLDEQGGLPCMTGITGESLPWTEEVDAEVVPSQQIPPAQLREDSERLEFPEPLIIPMGQSSLQEKGPLPSESLSLVAADQAISPNAPTAGPSSKPPHPAPLPEPLQNGPHEHLRQRVAEENGPLLQQPEILQSQHKRGKQQELKLANAEKSAPVANSTIKHPLFQENIAEPAGFHPNRENSSWRPSRRQIPTKQ